MIKVKIKTISPVFIGSGNSYPLYMLINNVRIKESIFSNKLYEYLIKEKKFLENLELLQTLTKYFDDFIKNYCKLPIKQEEIEYEILVHDELSRYPEEKEVQEVIKTVDLGTGRKVPYIPGSTIKGVITTALMYDYIIKNSNNQEMINYIIKTLLKDNKKRGHLLELYSYINKLLPEASNIYVSDALPEKYKLCLGKIYYGGRIERSVFLELLVEFEGEFKLESQIENVSERDLLDKVDKFSRDYLAKLANLKLVKIPVQNYENIIKNRINTLLKSDQKLMIVGRYSNLFSKSLYLLKYKLNINWRFVKEPEYIRLITINNREYDITGVCSLSY